MKKTFLSLLVAGAATLGLVACGQEAPELTGTGYKLVNNDACVAKMELKVKDNVITSAKIDETFEVGHFLDLAEKVEGTETFDFEVEQWGQKKQKSFAKFALLGDKQVKGTLGEDEKSVTYTIDGKSSKEFMAANAEWYFTTVSQEGGLKVTDSEFKAVEGQKINASEGLLKSENKYWNPSKAETSVFMAHMDRIEKFLVGKDASKLGEVVKGEDKNWKVGDEVVTGATINAFPAYIELAKEIFTTLTK